MRTHPFALLKKFDSALDVRFLTREDAVASDEDIARITGATSLASLHQVHGNRAVRVIGDSRRTEQADALATDTTGLTLTIRFADCQNFIVWEPEKRVACLIHAGWRGLKSGVIERAFTLLQREWAIEPRDTFVVAGPSLCMRCAEFTDPKTEAPEIASYSDGRCIDLIRAADDKLSALGVSPDRFERPPDCTRCSPDRYFSYRGGDREAVSKGSVNCFAVTIAG